MIISMIVQMQSRLSRIVFIFHSNVNTMDNFQKVSRFYYSKFHFENWGQEIWSVYACTPMTYFLYKCHTWSKFHKQQCSNLNAVFTLNSLPYKPTGPESSNIYRPTINSTGPNLKTTLMIINSNHQNSKHDDVPNIMWTCQLCIREDQNASKKKTKKTLYFGFIFILISWKF
jgi:hypothetical protein